MTQFLLIDDGPASGARNMAVDEFLLERAEREGGAPVLRLYSFDPPAVTLGFHQDPGRSVDIAAAAADGVDVVRRITGGRALLHAGELTYSVTARTGPPFGEALSDTFTAIAGVIVAALRGIGVDAGLGGARHVTLESSMASPCLVSTSRHEITARGRKISGSAQRRTGGSFIQHGSILLRGGSERIERYLPGDWKGLADSITTVEQETGAPANERALRDLVAGEFASRFGLEPAGYALSGEDLSRVAGAEESKAGEFACRGGEA
jgi:lipoate-protein ligase A